MPKTLAPPFRRVSEAAVGNELLGRIIDGSGRPLDGKGVMHATQRWPLNGGYINPLARAPIREPLDVGIRAINALLSVGRGQRLGLFAGSGVGKSVLLGMMTRYTDADVVVVGLGCAGACAAIEAAVDAPDCPGGTDPPLAAAGR